MRTWARLWHSYWSSLADFRKASSYLCCKETCVYIRRCFCTGSYSFHFTIFNKLNQLNLKRSIRKYQNQNDANISFFYFDFDAFIIEYNVIWFDYLRAIWGRCAKSAPMPVLAFSAESSPEDLSIGSFTLAPKSTVLLLLLL